MKTMIDLTEEHAERLRELALQRGEEEVARVVADALDHYFHQPAIRPQRSLLGLRGRLSDPEAESLRAESRRLRESWR